MPTTRTARPLLGIAAALALALVAPLALPSTAVDAASAKACKVRNVTRGGSYSNLQAAVNAARKKDKLKVRGTCKSKTRITNKKLTIKGERTKKSGPPTLKSTGRGPVLTIAGDFANVTIEKLTIRGDPSQKLHWDGGGIANLGQLTLENVTIRDLWTKRRGGGIYNEDGTVKLLGDSRILGNRSTSGGGIYNNGGKIVLVGSSQVRGNTGVGIASHGKFSALQLRSKSAIRNNTENGVDSGLGVVSMSDRARISGNRAREGAGFSGSSKLVMSGSSTISSNQAKEVGGGVSTGGVVVMKDASTITGNSAGGIGGGLYAYSWATLSGVTCAPVAGANVFGNSPDDCYLD